MTFMDSQRLANISNRVLDLSLQCERMIDECDSFADDSLELFMLQISMLKRYGEMKELITEALAIPGIPKGVEELMKPALESCESIIKNAQSFIATYIEIKNLES